MSPGLFVALAGVVVGLLALWRTPSAAPIGPATMTSTTTATGAERLSALAVQELAQRTVLEHGLAASPAMLITMAKIESDFVPAAIGDNGHALGLMQVSRATGRWLASEMGYHAFGRTLSDAEFLRPEVSLYLGAAYVDHLSRYRGIARSEEWIVRAYNGGPGWDLPADHSSWQTRDRAAVLANTLRHWTRYREAKARLGLA